jgi:hypothetical protein
MMVKTWSFVLFLASISAHATGMVCKEQRTDAQHGYSAIFSDDHSKVKIVEDYTSGRVELSDLVCIPKKRPPSLAPDKPYTAIRCDEPVVSFSGFSLDVEAGAIAPLQRAHLYKLGITGSDYEAVLDCFPPAPQPVQ